MSVYVIAEIGSNHDNSLEQAFRLIEVAAEAGADAAKFQLYRADKLYPGTITPGAIPDSWLPGLQAVCVEHDIDFLCSVFDLDTLDAYMSVSPTMIKIASPEATCRRLLDEAADTGLPLIVSTGAMTWADLDLTVDWLGDTEFTLLHCVSAYPAPPAEMNLSVIPTMRDRYDVPVGLSDHTLGTSASVAAVALGATIIEKHLTVDRSLPGADHPFALEPDEFRQMAVAVRETLLMLGDGVKRVQPSEDSTDRR